MINGNELRLYCVEKQAIVGVVGLIVDNRWFVEAVFSIARTGRPWRDLPVEFGKWNCIYIRFARWSNKNAWQNIFEVLRENADIEEVSIDSTVIRAHQRTSMPLVLQKKR